MLPVGIMNDKQVHRGPQQRMSYCVQAPCDGHHHKPSIKRVILYHGLSLYSSSSARKRAGGTLDVQAIRSVPAPKRDAERTGALSDLSLAHVTYLANLLHRMS
jgi:hypothetical protein